MKLAQPASVILSLWIAQGAAFHPFQPPNEAPAGVRGDSLLAAAGARKSFGVKVDAELQRQQATANSATIQHDPDKSYYFTTVLVGSTRKPLRMLVDTGSTGTWIMHSSCSTCIKGHHQTFDPTRDSKTLVAVTSPSSFSVAYHSGEVSGTLVQDTLTVGDIELSNVTFGLATNASVDFDRFPLIDGILGLGRGKAGPGGEQTFLQALKRPKYTVQLEEGGKDGKLAVNGDLPEGDVTYSNIRGGAGGQDWIISMDDTVAVGGVETTVERRQAYVDTGTSYVFGSADDVAKLMKLVPGSQTDGDKRLWQVPCDTTAEIQLGFSGRRFAIPARDWVGGLAESKNGLCNSRIYGIELVPGSWLLGQTFLRNVVAVFDVDGGRIGFVQVAGVGAAISPPITTTTSTTKHSTPISTSSRAAEHVTLTTHSSSSSVDETVAQKASPTKEGVGGKLKLEWMLMVTAMMATFAVVMD